MRLLSAALLLSAFALAQTPTIDQSLSAKQPGSVEISPDGRFVAYTVLGANWDDNSFDEQIWIASTAGGDRFQLTGGKKSSTSPRWSPDSKKLAFKSERDGKSQIYLISPTGGEGIALTSEEDGVGDFAWSPDGAHIAFASAGGDSKARKARKEKYGEFEIVGGDYSMNRLWVVTVNSENKPKAELLTKADNLSVADFAWSPDSKRIAFTATRDPDLGSRFTSEIYLIGLEDRMVKKLTDGKGPNSGPAWSPDGREIAYTTSNGAEFYYYANTRIASIPADGGSPRILTANFDEDPRGVTWKPTGIYFTAQQKTDAHLFQVDPKTLAIRRVSAPDHSSIAFVSFSGDAKSMAFLGAGPNRFREVFTSPAGQFEPKQLTNFADAWKGYKLAARELVEWKSSDGTAVEGVLIKPAGFDRSRKYPLLVVIHGGPTGVDTLVPNADRTYPVEKFAAKGALVLKVNYRGSAGYGEKFRALNVRNLGVGDYQDVISGVDALIAKGIVDKDRVGAMGWSQGGYISAFITCFSDRFKAVSVGAGISDWMTYYVNTDIHPFTRQYLKATPWDDPEIYRKTSPITYVKNARTPTLIQHGDQDKRVPPPNAFELRQALEDRGVPVKLVLYKGFGHGINKPKQQRSLMEQNYEWFSQYIWGEKPAE